MKTTLKELKNMAHYRIAKDITNFSEKDINELQELEGTLENIATSFGIYGMNGGLFEARNTRNKFVILSRNTNLFRLC